jgi:MFS family permease
LSAHVFGMYGLSPISGRLTDRFGSPPVILAGFVVMVVAAVSGALTPTHAGVLLAVPLFVLGFGWSFSFVAGSALLTHGLTYADRTRLQGSVDALVWTSAAVASASSGFIVTSSGYVGLCVVASLLVVVPIGVIASRRKVVTAEA